MASKTTTTSNASPSSSSMSLLVDPSMFSGGQSSSYQPLCFAPEVFGANGRGGSSSSTSFDVDEFIGDCRRRVPLESLLNDLQEYSASLQNELVELINRDYKSFVNLSTNLVGLEQVLKSLQEPLLSMRHRVKAVRDMLEAYVQQFDHKLAQRQHLLQRKERLELFVNIFEAISKIERLLHISEGEMEERPSAPLLPTSSSAVTAATTQPPTALAKTTKTSEGGSSAIAAILLNADEETSKLVQRVANEFNQLKFYLSNASHYPFVQGLSKRIFFIENSLQEGMQRLFTEGLSSKNEDIVANCLRTYAAIDRVKEAEELYRKHVVEPFVQKVVTPQHLEMGRRGSCEGLPSIYHDLLQWINEDCMLVLSITYKSLRDFDFLCNSIWEEVVTRIEATIPRIFLPGIPDSFLQNYLTSMEFVKGIQELCSSKQHVETFRKHPAFLRFNKKWNLPIYFQLRFQEIASAFEDSLSASALKIDGDAANSGEFVMSCTTSLWQSLGKCWMQGIYVPALSHRFYKLSLQLLARYKTWLEEIISTANAQQLPASTESQPADTEQYIYHHYDAERLLEKLPGEYFVVVMNANSHLPAELFEAMKEGYEEGMGEVRGLLPQLASLVQGSIISKCEHGLQPLKGITQTYRLTNKPVPTKHSYYVSNILRPLDTFLKAHSAHLPQRHVKSEWCRNVLTAVAAQYKEMAVELLQTSHKTEYFLKRYSQKQRKQEASAPDSMSDTDKIALQLLLDVQEFGRLFCQSYGAFGVTLDLPAYQDLLSAVSSTAKASSQQDS
ncbi:Conserved oligomeric Golgi complex subunit 2 [Balamuthia mandrillaris]